MRIGIIGDALDRQYAGIYYYTLNLVKALGTNDHINEYFLFRENVDHEIEGVTTVNISAGQFPFSRAHRLFVKIPKLARKLSLDVVIEPAHFGPFFLSQKIKRVTVIHDLTPLIHWRWHPVISGLLQKMLLPRIIRKADIIITNSEYTKSDIIKYLNKSKELIVTAYPGISDIFRPTRDSIVLGKYGLYKDYILYQGTLEPRKNLVNLIKGYELYRHSNPESRLQLILSGKQGWKADEVIRKKFDSFYQDDIILLGYVDRKDMPALFSGSTIFAYPSLYEGFGMPVLEALACGAVVIASDSSSLPEVARDYAHYFDPTDPPSISHAIAQGLSHSTNNMEQQIEYASSFSWTKTATETMKAIKKLSKHCN